MRCPAGFTWITKKHPNVKDLSGRVFGFLRVLGPCRQTTTGELFWLCRCRCQKLHPVRGAGLQSRTGSCGCAKGERVSMRVRTHGMTDRRVWRIWKGMIERCHKPAYGKSWDRYGGKGIFVCEKWRGETGFTEFLADMGDPGESSKLTIERKNRKQGYSPENCIWATYKTQARNRSNNRLLTLDGVTKTLAGWAEDLGAQAGTVWKRLSTYGWSVRRAVTTPVKIYSRRRSPSSANTARAATSAPRTPRSKNLKSTF